MSFALLKREYKYAIKLFLLLTYTRVVYSSNIYKIFINVRNIDILFLDFNSKTVLKYCVFKRTFPWDCDVCLTFKKHYVAFHSSSPN